MRQASASPTDKTVYLWWVPITYTADYKVTGTTWLANNQTSKTLTPEFPIAKDQWAVFNIDQTGNSNSQIGIVIGDQQPFAVVQKDFFASTTMRITGSCLPPNCWRITQPSRL